MKNICEWKKCKEVGRYKAPTDKNNSKKFQLLCKEHIKLFNSSWNYFGGMSQDEIVNFLRSDITWHRPTQKFGSADNFFNMLWNNALNDKFKILEDGEIYIKNKKLCEKDKDAFKILGLEFSSDWKTIQSKFKTLVKRFHPDKHAGDKQYEDKLKKITLAYTHLKMTMVTK